MYFSDTEDFQQFEHYGGADAAAAEAKKVGDVLLYAEGYTGPWLSKLGVFRLQAEVVQKRPTYKKQVTGETGETDEFLFYATTNKWLVGSDTSKTVGWWQVTSGAMTPSAITEAWETNWEDSKGTRDWHFVMDVKIGNPTVTGLLDIIKKKYIQKIDKITIKIEGKSVVLHIYDDNLTLKVKLIDHNKDMFNIVKAIRNSHIDSSNLCPAPLTAGSTISNKTLYDSTHHTKFIFGDSDGRKYNKACIAKEYSHYMTNLTDKRIGFYQNLKIPDEQELQFYIYKLPPIYTKQLQDYNEKTESKETTKYKKSEEYKKIRRLLKYFLYCGSKNTDNWADWGVLDGQININDLNLQQVPNNINKDHTNYPVNNTLLGELGGDWDMSPLYVIYKNPDT